MLRPARLVAALLAALAAGPAAAQDVVELPLPAGTTYSADVDIQGDYAVTASASDPGHVSVFRREASGAWVREQTLVGFRFPRVALGPGPRLAVAFDADWTDVVEVYARSASGTWVREARLEQDGTGRGVALDGEFLVTGGLDRLAVWRRTGTEWVRQCGGGPRGPFYGVTMHLPHLAYVTTVGSGSYALRVLDATTCATLATVFLGDSDGAPALGDDGLAYVRARTLWLRPDPTTADGEEPPHPSATYGRITQAALQNGFVLAASTAFGDPPEVFALRRAPGGWGVFRWTPPAGQAPASLALNNRYAVVGTYTVGGSSGRAFAIDLFTAPFFDPPPLYAPADSAADAPRAPTFAWGAVGRAQSYVLEVDDDASFGSPEVRETGLADTVFTVASGLAGGQTYHWRVRGDRAGEAGPWSAVRTFTTETNGPGPALVAPANGADGQTLPLTLAWAPVAGALSYRVQVDDDGQFDSPAVNAGGLEGTSYPVEAGLAEEQTYSWRVRATFPDGPGEWSAYWQFTMAVTSLPAPPALTSPANNAQDVPTAPTLRWQAAPTAAGYHVQLAPTPDFAAPTLDDTTGALSATVSGLANAQPYHWRVRSVNAVGAGPWSAVRTFTTVQASPVVPVPLAPADGASDVPTNPLFAWGPPSAAATYTLQVSTVGDFSALVVNATVPDTTYGAASLQPQRLHYWRVRAQNEVGTTGWSPVQTFVTGTTVAAEGGPPAVLALSDPHPNPSAGTVTFRVNVPAPGPVRLTVSDALGREVAVLLDGETAAGTHPAVLDGRALAPGVYVARLVGGGAVHVRRVTIAR